MLKGIHQQRDPPCDKVTADSEQTASRRSCLCAQRQVKPGHTQVLVCADMASAGRKPRTPGRGGGGTASHRGLGPVGCRFPHTSLGQSRPEWPCANEREPENMYQAVNHSSNLGPLHRLIISLNKTKVMFPVAPGKSGKQPRIAISGLELKAASDSPALCNDRSPALLSAGSLSSRPWWSSLLQKEEQPALIKPTYLGGGVDRIRGDEVSDYR